MMKIANTPKITPSEECTSISNRVAGLIRKLRRGRRADGLSGGRTLDNLVKFPSVKPDTAALGAVIDFNSLAIGHNQVDGWADGTFHDAVPPFWGY